MKMRSRWVYESSSALRWTKAESPWSIKQAIKSGLDIAPNPKLSHRFGESARSRLFELRQHKSRILNALQHRVQQPFFLQGMEAVRPLDKKQRPSTEQASNSHDS